MRQLPCHITTQCSQKGTLSSATGQTGNYHWPATHGRTVWLPEGTRHSQPNLGYTLERSGDRQKCVAECCPPARGNPILILWQSIKTGSCIKKSVHECVRARARMTSVHTSSSSPWRRSEYPDQTLKDKPVFHTLESENPQHFFHECSLQNSQNYIIHTNLITWQPYRQTQSSKFIDLCRMGRILQL